MKCFAAPAALAVLAVALPGSLGDAPVDKSTNTESGLRVSIRQHDGTSGACQGSATTLSLNFQFNKSDAPRGTSGTRLERTESSAFEFGGENVFRSDSSVEEDSSGRLNAQLDYVRKVWRPCTSEEMGKRSASRRDVFLSGSRHHWQDDGFLMMSMDEEDLTPPPTCCTDDERLELWWTPQETLFAVEDAAEHSDKFKLKLSATKKAAESVEFERRKHVPKGDSVLDIELECTKPKQTSTSETIERCYNGDCTHSREDTTSSSCIVSPGSTAEGAAVRGTITLPAKGGARVFDLQALPEGFYATVRGESSVTVNQAQQAATGNALPAIEPKIE